MKSMQNELIAQYDQHYQRVKRHQVDPRKADLSYYQTQFASIAKGLPLHSEVLDIGCGTGHLLYWLAKNTSLQLCGVDISPGQINLAKQYLPESVQLYQGDAGEFLQENSERFDIIFALDVLEHIQDEELYTMLFNVRQCLRNGGKFICRVPNMANLTASYSRYLDLTHQRGYTSYSLFQLLASIGFTHSWILTEHPSNIGQAIRMKLEYWLHRIIFRICGRGPEHHFASNITAISHK